MYAKLYFLTALMLSFIELGYTAFDEFVLRASTALSLFDDRMAHLVLGASVAWLLVCMARGRHENMGDAGLLSVAACMWIVALSVLRER